MSASDAAVISASIDEPVRFAEIFDRHIDRIRRYSVARVGASAADDVAAETFRIAFEQRVSFDLRAAGALPWLYGIAANLVRRELRSRARGYAALERFASRPSPFADPLSDVASRLDARDNLDDLRDALAALSDDERELLLLIAWDELSPTAGAQVLGIPAETARTRLHRARKKIRSHPTNRTAMEAMTDAT